MQNESAETANLERLLSGIGAGLDQFLKFEHKDALRADATWRETLDVALPQQGVGIDCQRRGQIEEYIRGFSTYVKTTLVRQQSENL
jgi:hypothetical protein